jgi:photosystem II stability/assembly factor-like uncharacterized protein
MWGNPGVKCDFQNELDEQIHKAKERLLVTMCAQGNGDMYRLTSCRLRTARSVQPGRWPIMGATAGTHPIRMTRYPGARTGCRTCGGIPVLGLRSILLVPCLLAVAACGAQATASSASPVSSTTAASVSSAVVGAITSLHMFDAMTGWAATTDQLLRTTDGALHWRDVTPPAPSGSSQSHIEAFSLSADDTWVVRGVTADGPGASQSAVSHTTDGGQKWRTITLPVFAVAQITFVDPEHGWMLANVDTAGGEQGVDVFRMTDNGLTWAKVSSAADHTGALPLQGRKVGLTFRDAMDGWAALTGPYGPPLPSPSTHWLYQTQNGGVTWRPAPLALPATLEQYPWLYVAGVLPPTFYSAQDGVLPVDVGSQPAGGVVLSLVYVTHDGGATWNATAPISTVTGATSLPDPFHWWIASEAVTDDSLFSTVDGGQHWLSLTPGAPFTQISVLSFVSSVQGWAIGGAGLLRACCGRATGGAHGRSL